MSTCISISTSIRPGGTWKRSAGRPSSRNYHGRVAIGPRDQTVGAALPDRLKAAIDATPRQSRRRGHRAARDRPLSDGPRRDAQRPARPDRCAHQLVADGVLCSVATNNVQNPFTPFGDASLLRMANLYANAAACRDQRIRYLPRSGHRSAGAADEPAGLRHPRRQPRRYRRARLPTADTSAIAELPDVLMGFKSGRQTFERQRPTTVPAG